MLFLFSHFLKWLLLINYLLIAYKIPVIAINIFLYKLLFNYILNVINYFIGKELIWYIFLNFFYLILIVSLWSTHKGFLMLICCFVKRGRIVSNNSSIEVTDIQYYSKIFFELNYTIFWKNPLHFFFGRVDVPNISL